MSNAAPTFAAHVALSPLELHRLIPGSVKTTLARISQITGVQLSVLVALVQLFRPTRRRSAAVLLRFLRLLAAPRNVRFAFDEIYKLTSTCAQQTGSGNAATVIRLNHPFWETMHLLAPSLSTGNPYVMAGGDEAVVTVAQCTRPNRHTAFMRRLSTMTVPIGKRVLQLAMIGDVCGVLCEIFKFPRRTFNLFEPFNRAFATATDQSCASAVSAPEFQVDPNTYIKRNERRSLLDPLVLFDTKAWSADVLHTAADTLSLALIGAILGDSVDVVVALLLVVNHHVLADILLTAGTPSLSGVFDWSPVSLYPVADRYAAQRRVTCTPMHVAAACGRKHVLDLLSDLLATVDRSEPHADPQRTAAAGTRRASDSAATEAYSWLTTTTRLMLERCGLATTRAMTVPNAQICSPIEVASASGNVDFLMRLMQLQLGLAQSPAVSEQLAAVAIDHVQERVAMEAAYTGLHPVFEFAATAFPRPLSKELLNRACTRAVEAGQHHMFKMFKAFGAEPFSNHLDAVPAVSLRYVMDAGLPLTARQKLIAENVDAPSAPNAASSTAPA